MIRAGAMKWLMGVIAVLLAAAAAAPLRAQQCSDGNECTANDMCGGDTCMGTPQAGASCDDFDECTGNDRCQADGRCAGTPQAGASCDDFDECSVNDRCQADGSCTGEVAPVDTPCGGGCGTCQALIPGAPLMCNGDPSNNGQACEPAFEIGPCQEARCQIAGSFALCLPALKVCPDTDGDPCTDICDFQTGLCERDALICVPTCETCNTSNGACEPANIGAGCDDFNVCTAQSRCEIVDIGEGVQRGLCSEGQPTVTIPTPTATSPVVTPSPEVTPTTPPIGTCVGDCDGNNSVVVNEMIVGVNIALGTAPVSQCTAFDADDSDSIEVNELIGGVNALLNGCPA